MIQQRQGNRDNSRGVIPKKEPHGKERPDADMDQKRAKQRKGHCAGHPGSLYKVAGHQEAARDCPKNTRPGASERF